LIVFQDIGTAGVRKEDGGGNRDDIGSTYYLDICEDDLLGNGIL
jgi:hypothetical protein